MGLETNFNQTPYFDDFDTSKDFHRVLFKPAVAVQARELTQLQTILQNQIESFGDNILREGTIIRGCSFTFLNPLPYVKILDLQTDGQPVVMSNYDGMRAVGLSTGVEAKIIAVRTGLESQTPDLNTLYVRYVKSNGSNKTFSTTENIRIQNFDTAVVVTTVTAAGTVTGESSTAIGNGVGLKVNDGVIYQKGFFIRVAEQTTIIERYSTSPDGVAVGFNTAETIVNSDNDTTLLDNAEGFNNVNAPGADRVKLTPTLTVKTVTAANADEDFFTIVEYQNGSPVRRKEKTQYSIIGDEFARRTAEESGNYQIRPFPLNIEAGSNSSFLEARVGAGLAYVDGHRVETFGTVDVTIDAATTFASELDQNVTTNLGHYVIANEFMGNIKFNEMASVELYDGPQNAFTANGVVIPASANGTQIGTATIRSVEHHNGTVGTAATEYRLYLIDIRMTGNNKFESTESVVFDGTNDGSADLVLENSKAVIKDFSFKRALWPVGRSSIKNIPSANTDFVYRTVNESLTTSTGGECVIALGSGEWTYGASATLNSTQKLEIMLICNETQSPYVKGQPIDLSGATVTTDVAGTTLTISGLSAPAAEMDVIAYYNVKKTAAAPAEKEAKSVYVKIQANTNPGGTTGTYSLGVPDVYAIQGVWCTTNGTYTESGSDVTSSFILQPNQKDAFYDLSYVQKKRSLTIGADDTLLFKVSVFQENNSGSFSDGFFSVNSYTGIDLEDIPVYKSELGIEYDLRDVVDFRPFCSNTIAYATTIGTANVANVSVGSTPTFSSGEKFIPAPNENMEIDYDYYLGRIDRLFVDAEGNFKVIQGAPEEVPTTPSPPARGMSIATIYVPPFPSLTSLAANRANKPSYATKMRAEQTRGYTMGAIGAIDARVRQLEYYTVLNALETRAKDLAILDGNGNDRFKNGIFADAFDDFNTADVSDNDFAAAIDPSFKELTPKISQFDIDLKVANVSSVTNFGDAATISKTDVTLIDQPYATTSRNCVTDFFLFSGVAQISPSYDTGYDVTRAPDFNLDVDLATPFIDFAESINEFLPLQQVNAARVTSRQTGSRRTGNRITTTTTTTTENTIRDLQVGFGDENKQQVGDFITDIRFNPFMREKEIKILVRGLRPSTEFFFFFDGADVSAHVAPALLGSSAQGALNGLRRSAAFGTSITSDSSGVVRAVFRIPANTFFVGDRRLEIMDVSTYSTRTNAVSYASINYSAYNYSVDKQSLNISTRLPEIDITQSTTTSVQTSTSFQNIPDVDGPDGGGDPIAQTFFIKREMASGDNVVYVTELDLFFKEKSSTNGVTVMLREVENGYPSRRIIPFSKVHLDPADVNASTTAAQATTVTFDAPIALKTNQEYAFVVRPDGNDPDYLIWVAKTGETDVNNNVAITQDVNDGVLFSSTNDRTWTPYQNENIKYLLRRASFSATSGTITLTNRDSEYLSINSLSGSFNNSEYVFVNATAVSAQTVSVAAGNNTVIGTNTNFQTYFTVGDHIVVKANTTTFDVLEIASIANDSVMTTTDISKYTNTAADFFSSVVGKVDLFESNDPAFIHLDDSSAKTGSVFAANDVIVGADSGASATIETVDNKNISFIAPNIYRTNTTQTKTTLSATRLFRDDTSANYTRGNIEFNNFTFLNGKSTVIKSRSNEISDADGDRSFALQVTLENTSGQTPRYSSPFVDVALASCKAYAYKINNDNSDEDGAGGAATSKYISKVVTLADGLDAEDLKVFLTAYRPPGTTIEVYGKFLSGSDSDDINSKPWSLLVGKDTNPFSQNADRFDFKEHEFNITPDTAPVTGGAYLNSSGTIEYFNGGSKYNNYKYFAIKIVMLSTDHHRVPRVADIRAIALAA